MTPEISLAKLQDKRLGFFDQELEEKRKEKEGNPK